MDVSLDQHLVNAFSAALVAPPAIVRPFHDSDASFRKLIDRLDDDYKRSKRDHMAWKHRGLHSRSELKLAYETLPTEERHRNMLLVMAEEVEKQSENFAKENHAIKKSLRNMVRQIDDAGCNEMNKVREIFSRLEKQLDDEIEERLSFALFLRALRAEHEPNNDLGLVLTSDDEIDAYFSQISV